MPTTRLRPLERQNERRLRTSYIFSADFFFLRINRSRKSDVFEIFSKTKTAARADLVGRYSVDQDLNLILGPRWRPGPKFNMDHIWALSRVTHSRCDPPVRSASQQPTGALSSASSCHNHGMYINITTGGSGPPRTPWPMAIQTQEQMKHSHLKNYTAVARATTSRVLGGGWPGWWLQRGARHELSSPPTKCSRRPCLN